MRCGSVSARTCADIVHRVSCWQHGTVRARPAARHVLAAGTPRLRVLQCDVCGLVSTLLRQPTTAVCALGRIDGDMDASTACVECSSGRYAAAGLTNCTSCAAGFADLDSDASTECAPCSAGHYAGIGVTACSPCAAGEYDDDVNASTVCMGCSVGYFSPSASIECSICPSGFHDNDQDPATPCDNDASACSAGHYSDAGSHSCDACAPGLADLDGDPSTPCPTCTAGTVSLSESISCTECAMGKVDDDLILDGMTCGSGYSVHWVLLHVLDVRMVVLTLTWMLRQLASHVGRVSTQA